MIALRNVSRTFAAGSINETRAIQELNMEVSKGEFVILVGSNGSGKSTLLNILSGSTAIDKGAILFDNIRVDNLPEHKRSKFITRVFQNPLAGTASDLTVMENFRLASLRTKRKSFRMGVDKKFKELVKEKISLLGLGLENKTGQRMGTLSGGQRQALTLIMAAMDESKILLMDEPTAALDPKTAGLLMQKADEIIRDNALSAILVTHQVKEAHQYGNRIIQMQGGKITRDLDAGKKKNISVIDIFSWFN
jgi:putative ABC transport system ATP-binding protein